jgi:hypothetical protein
MRTDAVPKCPTSERVDRSENKCHAMKATASCGDIAVAHRWHFEKWNLAKRRLAAALRGCVNEGLTNS